MSTQKIAILIRTCYDVATQFSYEWAENLKEALQQYKWQVIDLSKENANKPQVVQALQNIDDALVIFYGHGEPTYMVAQNEKSLIDLDNLHLLKNKKVYVMACLTTKELGKKAIDNMAQCYLGYEPVVYVSIFYPEPFGESVNKGLLDMLENPNHTFEQARQAMITEYNYWITHFTEGKGAKNISTVIAAANLRHNRDGLRLLGDKGVVL